MLEPRFFAELIMVAVVAASLVTPPPVWVLVAPLVVIVTPATKRHTAPHPQPRYKTILPMVAVMGVIACITLAVWAIFTHDSQVGLFVAYAVFGTATMPGHLKCMLAPEIYKQLKRGVSFRHDNNEKKET